MNREEMTMLGFEIVAYAGDARSKFLEALNAARDKNYEKAEKLIAEGKKCLNDAHNAQTEMLQKEAIGEDLSFSITLMHGQDHLMTTILLHDLIKHIIELYKRGDE